jgi:purine nucleosidase
MQEKTIKTGLLFMLLFSLAVQGFAQKQKVWIDADTGNETDDIYALARVLVEPSVDVVGISSAHFNNADLISFEKWNQYQTKNINTVRISQDLNEALLKAMNKQSIPHPIGADRQVGRAWGGHTPRSSPAATQLIAAAKGLSGTETLSVLCLGALTNVASAILIDTSIAKKIVVYLLGASYQNGVWNKNEFNIRNDLNAFDYLLDNASVNLVIMPVSTARPYRFFRDSLYSMLDSAVPVEAMMKERWAKTNPQDSERTLWDLALAEAFLNPQLAVSSKVLTPPENTQRLIDVYERINEGQMKIDFFSSIKKVSSVR